MITELKSIPDIWKKMPSEMHARRFLERHIWPTGRYCPHCGSTASTALRGRSCRPGLYHCRDCRLQFSVTTKTPMHATKLDLRLWVCALFLVITSSKGISSVVMSRLLGVNQKTAWKMGHAIRELMDDRGGEYLPLSGEVEADEAMIGGAPKSLRRGPVDENRISEKSLVFVATSRDGQARATIVENRQGKTLGPQLEKWAKPAETHLMTDGHTAYPGIAKDYSDHSFVVHKNKEYANPLTGAHVNTAEALISQIQRAIVGVYHNLGPQHLQRYLDEMIWRWNHREPASEHTREWVSKSGEARTKTTVIWKPIPVVEQMERLLGSAAGRQIRRSSSYGLRWP